MGVRAWHREAAAMIVQYDVFGRRVTEPESFRACGWEIDALRLHVVRPRPGVVVALCGPSYGSKPASVCVTSIGENRGSYCSCWGDRRVKAFRARVSSKCRFSVWGVLGPWKGAASAVIMVLNTVTATQPSTQSKNGDNVRAWQKPSGISSFCSRVSSLAAMMFRVVVLMRIRRAISGVSIELRRSHPLYIPQTCLQLHAGTSAMKHAVLYGRIQSSPRLPTWV